MKHQVKSKECGFEPRSSEEGYGHPESGFHKMGPTVPLGNIEVSRSTRLGSYNVWRPAKPAMPFKKPITGGTTRGRFSRDPLHVGATGALLSRKNAGKRKLKGPGVARNPQLWGIAATAHPPLCTSRRENAFVATGAFNIYSAVSGWCRAESSQMFGSLSTGFCWRREAQCELIQIDW